MDTHHTKSTSRLRRGLLLAALTLGAGAIGISGREPAGALDRDRPANEEPGVATRGHGNAVTRWNRLAAEILPVEVGPIVDERAMAVLHVAIHDALNGVDRRYEPFAADLAAPGASADAAIARAARDILVAAAPRRQARIEEVYAAELGGVPDGPAEDAGVGVGAQAARAILERRAADGVVPGPWPPSEGPITQPVYVPTGKPGDYDFTPPFDRPPLGPIALFPGLGRIEPWVIDVARHRLDGPDPLTSRRYARDLGLVRSIGRLDSTTRTPDQTKIAFFWFEGFAVWNDIARSAVEQHALDRWDAARTLALVNVAMMDAGIACFDAKYRFRFWRPYTAIRRAAEDGNERTEPDPDWLPLLWTPPEVMPPTFIIPPIPDCPSGAATVSAAAAEVLRARFGDRMRFSVTSATLPGERRHFTSFSQAAREAGMSRVYGGIHFLHAVEDGWALGRSVARVVARSVPRARSRRQRRTARAGAQPWRNASCTSSAKSCAASPGR
jgi:membrane-associated phospholipid phosphatase